MLQWGAMAAMQRPVPYRRSARSRACSHWLLPAPSPSTRTSLWSVIALSHALAGPVPHFDWSCLTLLAATSDMCIMWHVTSNQSVCCLMNFLLLVR